MRRELGEYDFPLARHGIACRLLWCLRQDWHASRASVGPPFKMRPPARIANPRRLANLQEGRVR